MTRSMNERVLDAALQEQMMGPRSDAEMAGRDPKPRAKRGEPFRFLQKAFVSADNDCIIWPFNASGAGYGRIYFRGRMVSAHRVMCEWGHGPPASAEMQALHSCDTKGCINPRHLKWGTASQNRSEDWERCRESKYSNAVIDQVLALYKGGLTQVQIAQRLGMPQTTVSYFIAGKARREIKRARDPIFVFHNCYRCKDGAEPCKSGSPRGCEYPRARND